MLTPLAALILNQATAPKTFTELEKKKYEAFTSLKSFTGRYVLATVPDEGVGERQEVQLTLGEKGRKSRITLNGTLLLESSRSTTSRWLISHTEKQYILEEAKDTSLTIPAFSPLRVEPGAMNFRVDESGMRFASDPDPTILSSVEETLDGRKTLKISAKAENKASNGVVDVVQWFDQGTWIVRRFEIKVVAGGKQRLRIVGNLQEAVFNANVPDSAFDLPPMANGYKRLRP